MRTIFISSLLLLIAYFATRQWDQRPLFVQNNSTRAPIRHKVPLQIIASKTLQHSKATTAAPAMSPENIVPLSENAKIWASSLPQPHTAAERLFLYMLAYYRETTEEVNLEEMQSLGAQFLSQGVEFDGYLREVLSRLAPSADQRERNFIYVFARSASPDSSLSEQIMQDWYMAFESGLYSSRLDREALAQILMAQNDLTFEEKFELFNQYNQPLPSN